MGTQLLCVVCDSVARQEGRWVDPVG